MAQQLDLQEQEQLDQLKAFWNQYGNLITWVLTIGLAAFAAFQIYSRYEQNQASAAGTVYGDLEKAATAGDAAKAGRLFDDMRKNYGHGLGVGFLPVTTYTLQGGLLAAKVQAEKGQADAAAQSLAWVAANGNPQYAGLAQLRLSGVLADQKKFDEALKALDAVKVPELSALVADRRGDILNAQGKTAEAVKAYEAAYAGIPATGRGTYRQIVETKLVALGAAPAASAASAAAEGQQ